MTIKAKENSKCYICKHNFKSTNYSEPKCNCMCNNYSDFEPITNYERIQRMTVEEMAAWIITVQYLPRKQEAEKYGIEIPTLKDCVNGDIETQIKWLNSEVQENDK